MAVVLMLGVQDTADALEFRDHTASDGDLQTISTGREFTISFSVSLGSNTTPIRHTTDGYLVSDNGTTRIDSSGYEVFFVTSNNQEYRVSTEAAALSATYVRNADGTYTSVSAPFYVSGGSNVPDSGSKSDGTVVDSTGATVYIQSGTDPNFTYSGARAAPNARVADANRYHYNQEAISISVPDGTTLVKVGNYRVNVTSAESPHPMNELASSMNEDKLTSSIRLTYSVSTAATLEAKTITITDNTPANDDPRRTTATGETFTFTVFVVPALDTTTTLGFATGTDAEPLRTAGYMIGNDQGPRRIDTLFTPAAADSNAPVIYKVEGPGRLYVEVGNRKSRSLQTLPTSKAAPVFLDMNGGSNRVTVRTRERSNTQQSFWVIFSEAQIEIISGNHQTGVPNSRLRDPLGIRVKDGKGRPLSGLAVSFNTSDADTLQPIIGSDVYLTNSTTPTWASAFGTALVTQKATATIPTAIADNTTDRDLPRWVPTDRSGEAQVYLKVGAATTPPAARLITVTAGGATATFFATSSESTDIPSLEIVSGDNQRSAADGKVADPLIVRVLASNNQPLPTELVTFTTTKGYLTTLAAYQDSTLTPNTMGGPATQVTARTDLNGRAAVSYDLVNHEGAADVIAEISSTTVPTYQRRITFNINGGAAPTREDTASDTSGNTSGDVTPTLTVGTTRITGRPGSTQQLAITASQTAQVGNFLDRFLEAGGSVSPSAGTGTFTSTLTLPNTDGSYPLTVSMGNLTRTVTVTVSSTAAADTPAGSTLRISSINPSSGAPGTPLTVTVRAADADGDPVEDVSIQLRITSGGGTFSPSTVITNANGVATSRLTLGSTPGNSYYITAFASGYTFNAPAAGERVVITGPPPAADDTPAPRAVGEADAIDVYDGNNQRGIPNVRLSEPLVVEVVDANDNPVASERVTFRATRGSGRFSPARPRTDRNGRADTIFTPTSSGTIRIAASVEGVSSRAVFIITTGEPPASLTKVSGDSQSGTPGDALANPFVVEVKDADGETIEGIPVTFSITAGGGSLSAMSATTDEDGRAGTTLTLGSRAGVNSVEASVSGVDPVTFSTSVDAKILVAAANRPVMYWIANGALYRLAGAKEAKIAENVNGVAVGGGKLYWTAQTGISAGTINSANLDGSGATVLTAIMAVPIGIAVDTANSLLYWTNSRGRIQSAALTGKSIRNVRQNLSDPTDIVVSNGFIYWTEGGDTLKRVNIKGQKQVQDIAANLDTVGGLAVSGGKVYWTEQTGESAGTINAANLNGTQFKTLATLLSAPIGIAVDTAGSHLYWTNSRGRVQRANLDGSKIRNVVDGLIAPSTLAIGGANAATATPTATAKTPAKKDNAKYDVNGDGKVDNVDASLVASGLDTGNAKYDVNGDGAVNFLDLLLIFDNRDDAAAGAPIRVGLKLTAVQRDRIAAQIDLLIATNDRSPAAMRTLVYLQQLLATARPEQTQLLANYPNPFNPETWMPYELATDTDVRLTIYNAQGVVIRVLHLGQQSAGYYTDRERAAYWDGRNALGEQVASGIYFYQLETDDMSSLRKMVILK